MRIVPLPETRLSLITLAGAVLQNPRCGTTFRATRSASGIGVTAAVRAGAGGAGRNRSALARCR